jgi:hypothetical protein
MSSIFGENSSFFCCWKNKNFENYVLFTQ